MGAVNIFYTLEPVHGDTVRGICITSTVFYVSKRRMGEMFSAF